MSSTEKTYRNLPNRWVSVQLDGTAQLTYSPRVDPAPLTVSSPGLDPVLGSLEVVITNPTGATVQVTEIDFNIPVGPGASLTSTTADVQYTLSDTTTWSLTGPSTPVTDGIATYSITPTQGLSAPLESGASLVLQIYDFTTNTTPCAATIEIQETIGSDVGGTSFQVTTFPMGFYFNSLRVTTLQGSADVAVAQVPLNQSVTLFWNASVLDAGAATVFQSNVDGQQSFTPTIIGKWTTPGGLQTHTIFTVQIVTTATPGGVPLVASLSTAIAVQDSVIVASTLTVNGDSVLTGMVNTGVLTSVRITTGGAMSSGSVNTGALNATGTATFNNVDVGSQLQVNGNFLAAASQISGALSVAAMATFNGGISGNGGTVSIFGSPQIITPGLYSAAPTDGFILGTVDSGSILTLPCIYYIYGSTEGFTASALGGNVGYFGLTPNGPIAGQAGNVGNFLLPVRKGATWNVGVTQLQTNQTNAPYSFYWISLGAGPLSQVERIGDAVAPFRPHLVKRVPVAKENLINELADIIDSLVDKPMPPATRSRLREVLTKINTDEYTLEEF